jgi:hypothetical protein
MLSHKLILEKDCSKAEWTLEWDESFFRLYGPDGKLGLEPQSAQAYRLIELQNLYNHQRICFVTPHGSLVFKRQKEAIADVRSLVEAGLRSDLDYRQQIRERSRRLAWRGLGMFFGGAIPFALYCWWASWAPNPPPPQFRWVAPFIKLALLLLLGLAIAGMSISWFGISQQMRIRRIEKDLSSTEN